MEKPKKSVKPLKIFVILSVICFLFVLSIPVLKYWDREAAFREKTAITEVYWAAQGYLDDGSKKGVKITGLTCEDIVRAGYLTQTPKEALGIKNFEIKITEIDGKPSVEYVKSKKHTYIGVESGEFDSW